MSPDVREFAQVMEVILLSLAGLVSIALGGRVLWRFGSRVRPAALHAPDRDDARLQRLETAVDAIAIEVERISESQRFMVTLLSDSLPARRADHAGELGPAAPGQARRAITAP